MVTLEVRKHRLAQERGRTKTGEVSAVFKKEVLVRIRRMLEI